MPGRGLGSPDMALVDLHGGGLPDILEMNGAVRYWRNLGEGRFDLPRTMREAPPHSLADPGVQMIDADGDGRMDLLVTNGPLAGYYPLEQGARWAQALLSALRRSHPASTLDDPRSQTGGPERRRPHRRALCRQPAGCFFNDPDPAQAGNAPAVRRAHALGGLPQCQLFRSARAPGRHDAATACRTSS